MVSQSVAESREAGVAENSDSGADWVRVQVSKVLTLALLLVADR